MDEHLDTTSNSGFGTIALSSLHAALGVDPSTPHEHLGVNLTTPTLNIGWARCPDPQSYPEELEAQAFSNLPTLDSEQLCEYCSSIPFELLGFHRKIRGDAFDGRFRGDRPFVQVLQNTKKCFFCQKLALLFQDWKSRKAEGLSLSTMGHITIEVMPHWLHSVEVDEAGLRDGRILRLAAEFTFWENAKLDAANFTFQRCSEPALKVSDFCVDLNTEALPDQGPQPYCGRIRPLLADQSIFKRWKDLCESQHGSNCNAIFPGEPLERIRLIDVEERCIIEVPHDQKYVALSYVWGGVHKLELKKSNVELLGKAGALQSDALPKTVTDALKVTRSLGERYLWVDSLCIVQDDEDDKQYFIPNMDTVYQNALVTVIALSGETSDAGLAGVRSGSRYREEFPFTIRGTPILTSLDPARKMSWSSYLGDSVWDRRAWTFQEKLFSSRTLIFTVEQIYWECQHGSWCEEGIWEVSNNVPHIYRRAFDSKPYLLSQSRDLKDFLGAYTSLVENYTSREFSFHSDALNAFSGVIHFMERTWDQKFFWGLPCSLFSAAFQWCLGYGDPNKATPRRRLASVPFKSDDGIVHSLPLPSWCWAGWLMKTSMPNISSRGRAIEVTFHRFTSSGRLVAISELHEEIQPDEGTHREQWKKSDKTTVTLDDVPPEVVNHPFKLTFLTFWSSSAWVLIHWHMGPNGTLFPNLGWTNNRTFRCSWKQKPPLKAAILEDGMGIGAGQLVFTSFEEAVVIGRDVFTHVGGCGDMLLLMLIKREGHVVYRYAVVSIAEEEWLELQHSWNLFVLG